MRAGGMEKLRMRENIKGASRLLIMVRYFWCYKRGMHAVCMPVELVPTSASCSITCCHALNIQHFTNGCIRSYNHRHTTKV
jgi:hypothetical protein